MDESQASDDAAFRQVVRDWLEDSLSGEFASLRGRGGTGRQHEAHDERLAWNRHLAAAGWTCLGWPVEHGGHGASVTQQVIFHEEYARAGAPTRVNHLGEELLGPTLIAFGTPEQQARFLPKIKSVEELWCQGYSEPGAGSDLAGVSTTATLVEGVGPAASEVGGPPGKKVGGPPGKKGVAAGGVAAGGVAAGGVAAGGEWSVTGQKVWTSFAHLADWCFVVARTDPGSKRHHGLSYLLVPMKQAGVEVRPIQQLTGTSEFNEVFFDDARTDASLVVGAVGDGWKVAMGTLGFERGVATLGQQVGFRRELDGIIALAKANGTADDPVIRAKLTRAWVGLEVMHAHALRTLASGTSGERGTESSVAKLLWAHWHRGLGELAMEVSGAASMVESGGGLDDWQRLFLFSRADTIYGGSDEIQRNIIAERTLGLPREARV